MADTTLKEGTRLDGLLNDHILYTDGGFEICGLAEHDAALIHDELRALRESHDALVEALKGHGNVAGRHGWHSTLCTVTGNCPPECAQSRAALAKAEALHGKQVQCAACLANREAHDMSDAVLGGCEHG